MATVHDTSLREYLRLQRRKVPPCIGEYDTFLLQLWTFFELRSAAEDYYDKHRYLAKSRNGALPLPWVEIKRVLDTGGPPEQPITRIAKKDFAEVEELIRNLRKVLSRVREKVNIGRVQQVDSQCLRWLTRQPGRDAIEKAGSKQEILGVVRVENYNTLENRVLKDFLQRCFDLCSLYIRVNESKHNGRWRGHAVLKTVARFRGLCLAGLSLEVMDSIGALYEMPQPNYVLQQDRLYSKIWRAYCTLLRQEDIADKLWSRRADVDDLYSKCINGVGVHCSRRAKYHTNIWFSDIDGKRPLIENPCWENEQALLDIVEPELPNNDVTVVDFSAVWDDRTELVYPKGHPNAYPYIKNPHRPSLDEVAQEVSLESILLREDDKQLRDYLRSYYGLVGGKEWIVLTPDSWDAAWIDKVRGARPSELLSRKVFMLWRSIAAVLGLQDDANRVAEQTIMVDDGYMFPFVNHCLIKYVRNDLVRGALKIFPQRASKILHGDDCKGEERRFWLNRKSVDGKLDSELLDVGDAHLHVGSGCSGANRHDILVKGAMRYVGARNRGEVSYFDELDPLWLVVQNRAEEVEFKSLIKHDECHPGGEEYIGERISGGRVLMSSRRVSLNLLWGQKSDTAKLKQVERVLDEQLTHDCDIDFEARVTPGQGLATIMFTAEFVEEPRLLELQNMKETELTKARIEREMKRHFPPVMPYVEASSELWVQIRDRLKQAITNKRYDDGYLFAQARDYYGPTNPYNSATMSPVDRLKRENVFGNSPGNRYPVKGREAWFLKFFADLAGKYKTTRSHDILHLLAWTYQHDNGCLDVIRSSLHKKYVRNHGSLDEIEVSFCSNNMAAGDLLISDMITEAMHRIGRGDVGQKEMRLLYNLLQFNPSAVKACVSQDCKCAFNELVSAYNKFEFYTPTRNGKRWGGQNSTKFAGYFLKCMLFLLHRRRFDGAFLSVPSGWNVQTWKWDAFSDEHEGWYPYGQLGDALPCKHEALRRSLIEYVNGRGTLDGIPSS